MNCSIILLISLTWQLLYIMCALYSVLLIVTVGAVVSSSCGQTSTEDDEDGNLLQMLLTIAVTCNLQHMALYILPMSGRLFMRARAFLLACT